MGVASEAIAYLDRFDKKAKRNKKFLKKAICKQAIEDRKSKTQLRQELDLCHVNSIVLD